MNHDKNGELGSQSGSAATPDFVTEEIALALVLRRRGQRRRPGEPQTPPSTSFDTHRSPQQSFSVHKVTFFPLTMSTAASLSVGRLSAETISPLEAPLSIGDEAKNDQEEEEEEDNADAPQVPSAQPISSPVPPPPSHVRQPPPAQLPTVPQHFYPNASSSNPSMQQRRYVVNRAEVANARAPRILEPHVVTIHKTETGQAGFGKEA